MGVYLVVGQETFKADKVSKEVMFRLKRANVLSKRTVMSSDRSVYQHIYIHDADVESIVKSMVCSVFNRSVPVTSLALLMDQIEELWSLAINRTSVFTDSGNQYLTVMLCELAHTQSAERITSMVHNFKIIRALYGQNGYNLGPMDRLPQFCSTDGLRLLHSKPVNTFYTNMQQAI